MAGHAAAQCEAADRAENALSDAGLTPDRRARPLPRGLPRVIMEMLMRSMASGSKELWSGLLFLTIGCVSVGMATQYPIGTLSRMGPGFFPFGLGAIIAILGLIFLARAFTASGTPLSGSNPLALVCVLGSAALFAGLLGTLGLAISAFVLVIAAYVAGPELNWRRMLALGVGLAAFVVILFALLLRMQVAIGPTLWS